MNLHMPITKSKIRNHFHYSLWKYLVLVALALLVWNLIGTTTRYRAPEHLKVELYADGYLSAAGEESLNALMNEIHEEALPQMEEVTQTIITQDETYGQMQLLVWVAAGQGDVYLLTEDRFESVGQSGAFVDLQPYIDSGALDVSGLDLAKGYVRDSETREKILCGIPADALAGLKEYGLLSKDMRFGVLVAGGNIDNSVVFLNALIQKTR